LFPDAFQWHFPVPNEGNWLTVIVDLMRPVSEPGFVTQQSADPLMDPYINITFLENNLDEVALREGIRFIDDMLMTGDGFKDIISEDDPWPMPRNSNEEMGKLILEWSQTGFRRYTHRIAVMNFKFLTVM
jgi:choline dehydrogenase